MTLKVSGKNDGSIPGRVHLPNARITSQGIEFRSTAYESKLHSRCQTAIAASAALESEREADAAKHAYRVAELKKTLSQADARVKHLETAGAQLQKRVEKLEGQLRQAARVLCAYLHLPSVCAHICL